MLFRTMLTSKLLYRFQFCTVIRIPAWNIIFFSNCRLTYCDKAQVWTWIHSHICIKIQIWIVIVGKPFPARTMDEKLAIVEKGFSNKQIVNA